MNHPAWIEIDLRIFKKNLRIIKQHIASSQLCLVVKANAYGHGLIEIAQAAQEAGVDRLAVAHTSEGVQLRRSGIKIPILVLGAIHEEQISDLLQHQLECSLSSEFKADLLGQHCSELNQRCKVHLEIDTGMRRTGIRAENAHILFKNIVKKSNLDLVGIYSHFSDSSLETGKQTTEMQLRSFLHAVDPMLTSLEPKPLLHIANSGAICNFQNTHLDMVRCGILAFGYFQGNKDWMKDIKPFFSLKARISYFKAVEGGKGISYGHSYAPKELTRIITVPVGYGDGFRRALANKASVLVRGERKPIVGAICMDQFMVDIGKSEAFVGEEVVLLGSQNESSISLEEMSEYCDTIPYEILCGFNNRLPRIYRK